MNKIIKMIEKMKPFFEKIASNPYLAAIRDGFVALMPVVLFIFIYPSSICTKRLGLPLA